jgi:hypothetical protein
LAAAREAVEEFTQLAEGDGGDLVDELLDAYAHELAEKIRREADDADIPGSPATPDMIRGMKHAAGWIDPEVTQ